MSECASDFRKSRSIHLRFRVQGYEGAGRGEGVGEGLYEEGMRYLSYSGVANFYLFTDTSCNYGFYEHQGLKRRVQRQKEVVVNGMKQGMNFFIYDNVQG